LTGEIKESQKINMDKMTGGSFNDFILLKKGNAQYLLFQTYKE